MSTRKMPKKKRTGSSQKITTHPLKKAPMKGAPPLPLLVVSGPSGSGQTSLAAALLKKTGDLLGLVRGTTTRPRQKRRGGDFDHIFISRKLFLERQKRGGFIETDQNAGYYYGTSRQEIERVVGAGRVPLLTLTVDGFKKIAKNSDYRVCSIFIKAENLAELRRRILARQKDLSPKVLAARLKEAKKALRAQKLYDHVVINRRGRLKASVKQTVKYVDECFKLR